MGDDDREDYRRIMEMVKQLVRQALEQGQVQPGMHGFFIMVQGVPTDGCSGACGEGKPAQVLDTMAEVHDTDDEIRVLTEMPGVDEENLHLRIREGILWIIGISQRQAYRARVAITGVEPEPARCTCRHGVVEAVFRKMPGGQPG